jgi:hypothetical protein
MWDDTYDQRVAHARSYARGFAHAKAQMSHELNLVQARFEAELAELRAELVALQRAVAASGILPLSRAVH